MKSVINKMLQKVNLNKKQTKHSLMRVCHRVAELFTQYKYVRNNFVE